MAAQLEGAVKPEDIAEAELKAYFEAHASEWNKPEEVRVSAIILADKAKAAAAAKEALGDDGRTNKGFRDLVTKYSIDEESRLRGGDLRYFAKDATHLPREVVDAAFALAQPGDVVGPIAAGGKHYLLKQTGRRRAITRGYEQVKRQIQNTLWKSKRADAQQGFVDGLRAKAKVEVVEANLAKVRIEPAPAATSAHHGGLPDPDELDEQAAQPGEPEDR
jgi:parvulin-like peptidyl-prolyl isomerase